jgi:hypothetical protein
MQHRSRAIALSLLPCALLLTACGSSFQAVKPTIDASLLLPCQDPQLAPLDNPSDNDLAVERLRLAKAYLDCKARHQTLADRVK